MEHYFYRLILSSNIDFISQGEDQSEGGPVDINCQRILKNVLERYINIRDKKRTCVS